MEYLLKTCLGIESRTQKWRDTVSVWNKNPKNIDFFSFFDISEIVFGERFKVKDFENWSLRLREKIKRQLIETESEFCF